MANVKSRPFTKALLSVLLLRIVLTAGCGSGSGNVAEQTPPSITTQPADQTVTVGQTATFSVTAQGTPPPSYQWQRGGTAIPGATSSSYTTPATTATDNGATFQVVVSNSAGSVTSRTATLTVNTPPVSNYVWKQLKTGAGGWVVGMFIHPDGSVVYARTDTGGAYRLNQSTKTWTQIVTSNSLPSSDVGLGNYGGVVGIVAAPSDHNRAYMAAYLGSNNTNVYSSVDQGAHWTKTALPGLNDNANGDGRQMGERLAVDPANANVLYYGSMSSGLFVTNDAGAHWQQVAQVPSSGETTYGTGNVRFDPTSGVTQSGLTKVIYATVYQKGVFRSADGGTTWQKVTGGAGAPPDSGTFQHIDIGSDGTFYLANWDGGAWKFNNSQWTNITPSGNPSLGGIAVDPNNPNRIFAFDSGGTPYRSLDGGLSWTQLDKTRTATDVPWLAFTGEDYMSLGTVIFDPQVSDRLWFAEGIGVWYADNNTGSTIAWQSLNAGIEQLVPNNLVAPPGSKPVTASWDRALFYHTDVDQYPASHGPTKRFNAGWDVAYSAGNPQFLVASVYDPRQCCSQFEGPDNQSGYSADGGQTWTVFPPIANGTLPADLRFGDIAVAATDTQNIVWLPTNNAAPYFTKDRGQTWNKITLPGVSVPGSHFAYYLRRQILTADTVQDHTFYLYHDDSNQIFKTTDGGVTWSAIPVSNFPSFAQYNAKLKAVPGNSGHLCFTTGLLVGGSRGVFCSEDSGATWTELPATSNVSAFGYGKPVVAGRYPTIFIQGQVNGDTGIWCTTDKGVTWGKLTSYPLGIPDVVSAMDGDRDVFGRVYIGIGGSGYAYGDPGMNPPANLCGSGQ